MRIDLRGRKASVAQQFLDRSEVCATFQKVGGGAVTEPMRPEIGDPTGLQPGVDDAPNRPRINASAPGPDEESTTGPRPSKHRSPVPAPGSDRVIRGQPERHSTFFGALTEYANDSTLTVDVVDVEADQLADPNTRGVEQLEDGVVAQRDGGGRTVVRVRPGRVGFHGQTIEHRRGVGLLQDGWQRPPGL